jgi:hypothetical protein
MIVCLYCLKPIEMVGPGWSESGAGSLQSIGWKDLTYKMIEARLGNVEDVSKIDSYSVCHPAAFSWRKDDEQPG